MDVKGKNVVVTGGSSGLGLGLVEALVAQGANVTVVARGAQALASVRARFCVTTVCADVTDAEAAQRILAASRPEVLVLNAGARPLMGRLDQIGWDDFCATWETDVKAGFHWLQAVQFNRGCLLHNGRCSQVGCGCSMRTTMDRTLASSRTRSAC